MLFFYYIKRDILLFCFIEFYLNTFPYFKVIILIIFAEFCFII